MKHRLDFETTNSQTGFNSLLRIYSVQNFAAKTRVKILNFIKSYAKITQILVFAIKVVICCKNVTKNISFIVEIFHE